MINDDTPPNYDSQITPEPVVKQSNFLVVLLSTLLLLACLIAGFFAYQTQNLVKELTKLQITPTPKATIETEIDLTANWNVFSSPEFKFSFKYPQESVLKSDLLESDGSVEFNNFVFLLEKTNDSLANYVNKLKDTNEETPINKVVGEKTAIEWIGSYKNAPARYISFQNNGYIYSFAITPIDDLTNFNEKETEFLGQIVSTFKFTDAATSSSPVACTMEAKICPDGSAVGRSGPKCEFAACPTQKPTTSPTP